MVYRDGLENRYGLTAIGGSNPSPSAKHCAVNNRDYIKLVVVVVAVAITFGLLWRKGQLMRLRNYILETREELRKCTWPSWDELRGSTLVVMVSILMLGLYTVGIDLLLSVFVNAMAQL